MQKIICTNIIIIIIITINSGAIRLYRGKFQNVSFKKGQQGFKLCLSKFCKALKKTSKKSPPFYHYLTFDVKNQKKRKLKIVMALLLRPSASSYLLSLRFMASRFLASSSLHSSCSYPLSFSRPSLIFKPSRYTSLCLFSFSFCLVSVC